MINVVIPKIKTQHDKAALWAAILNEESVNLVEVNTESPTGHGLTEKEADTIRHNIRKQLIANSRTYCIGLPASFYVYFKAGDVSDKAFRYNQFKDVLAEHLFDRSYNAPRIFDEMNKISEGILKFSDFVRFLQSDKRSCYIAAPSMSGKTYLVNRLNDTQRRIFAFDMDMFGCRGVHDPESEWYIGSRIYTGLRKLKLVPPPVRILMAGCCTNQIELLTGFNEMSDVKTVAYVPNFSDWLVCKERAFKERSEWWIRKFESKHPDLLATYLKSCLEHILFSQFYFVKPLED